MTIDEAVQIAVSEYEAWYREAHPSRFDEDASPYEIAPRVMVQDGDKIVSRRPFKLRGEWRVRWAGTGRIIDPRRIDGHLIFSINYGRSGS